MRHASATERSSPTTHAVKLRVRLASASGGGVRAHPTLIGRGTEPNSLAAHAGQSSFPLSTNQRVRLASRSSGGLPLPPTLRLMTHLARAERNLVSPLVMLTNQTHFRFLSAKQRVRLASTNGRGIQLARAPDTRGTELISPNVHARQSGASHFLPPPNSGSDWLTGGGSWNSSRARERNLVSSLGMLTNQMHFRSPLSLNNRAIKFRSVSAPSWA